MDHIRLKLYDIWSLDQSLVDIVSGSNLQDILINLNSLAAECHARLSCQSCSSLRAHYRSIQCAIASLELEVSLQSALNALDKALIVSGSNSEVLNLVDRIEALMPPCEGCEDIYNSGELEWACEIQKGNSELKVFIEPSVITFINECNGPFLLRGIIDGWKALKSWRDPCYLSHLLGHRLVPVELGRSYLDNSWSQSFMIFKRFMLDYVFSPQSDEIAYLAQFDLLSFAPKLASDVDIPEYCFIELSHSSNSAPLYRNVWIGMKGCTTPAHVDPYDNLFCQVVGVKLIRLFDPNSYDPGIPTYVHLLMPGESIFIPKGWWHQLESNSFNISISHWF